MLRTLQSRTDKDIRGLLSQAALSLQPRATEFVVRDEVAALLSEVREALRIRPDDNSHPTRARLQSYFGDLLSEILLPADARSATRDRLGLRGLLAPGQYDIKRNPELSKRGGLYRAKWAHVEDAIQNADVVEHFRVVDGMANVPLASLFMRRPPNAYQFWWLIHCQRDGAQLNPLHAWRLFDDTFSREAIETPRIAIVSFANKFGTDLLINGKRMKIAFREVVPNPDPGKTVILVETGDISLSASGTNPEILVGFSYGVDHLKYSAYLDGHGIPAASQPSR